LFWLLLCAGLALRCAFCWRFLSSSELLAGEEAVQTPYWRPLSFSGE
jgi:hypothetical protein